VELEGDLRIDEDTRAVVVFAHGSGSSRLSKRNRFVADCLNEVGLGTLLFDLLTAREDTVFENRFDIPLLTERLICAARWVREQAGPNRGVGLFGASTGAAAALDAAAEMGDEIGAVVSRGGRPDLAQCSLERVICPTLLIVGALDHPVVEWNEAVFEELSCVKSLELVPGATHLFEEPGTLDAAARLAAAWFQLYLGAGRPAKA
jgi:dienelactone hydrolase